MFPAVSLASVSPSASLPASLPLAESNLVGLLLVLGAILALLAIALPVCFGLRWINHDEVAVIEKLWSPDGSVKEGRILALSGEAGYQSELLRGGIHTGFWPWQYSLRKLPLVTIPQNKLGYVYARDGAPLPPDQTLGAAVACNHFQDARAFLENGGSRGRQRALLREGVYAINLALFTVITEDRVYRLDTGNHLEAEQAQQWRTELASVGGFDPVVVGPQMLEGKSVTDTIGVVTVQDGPGLAAGEIIAPAVDAALFQDPEAFLAAGGRRGRQYPVLTDGTWFINRWFAKIEVFPKTVVPIGQVGVVVSYTGKAGKDVSGEAFRHGERVAVGERGVWQTALGPGKYPFNPYAGRIVLVPTTNFVLHWITGRSESHRYDEELRSIELVTRDAYEPTLPLSVVVHIDYQRAPSVIQRFGDVQRLITQTLDPLLSAYFRDIAHTKTMLELLQKRDEIQSEARAWLCGKFHDFDIECVDVLIGKPSSANGDQKIETLLEQLRLRQFSIEQLETLDRQRAAADKQRQFEEAKATAARQSDLTNSHIQVQIRQNQAEAELASARKQAEQAVVVAEGELSRSRRAAEQTVLLAKAECERQTLVGQGAAEQARKVGLAEAEVMLKKVASYGDPRLYTLALVAEHLSRSAQPLVPDRLVMSGGDKPQDLIGTLMGLLSAKEAITGAAPAVETAAQPLKAA